MAFALQPHYIRKVVQTDGLQVEEPTPEVKRSHSQLDTARTMMILLQAVVQHGTAGRGRVDEARIWRQDGDDEQLYRRVVYRVFAVGDLRNVDWVRQSRVPGREGDRSEGCVAYVDGLS